MVLNKQFTKSSLGILPCPFCGSSDSYPQWEYGQGMRIVCGSGCCSTRWHVDLMTAKSAWNARSKHNNK